MDLQDKLKNLDPKALESGLEMAEKLLGTQATEKAKESLKSAGGIQEIINKLTKEDIAAIQKAVSGKGLDADDLGKKLKDLMGG